MSVADEISEFTDFGLDYLKEAKASIQLHWEQTSGPDRNPLLEALVCALIALADDRAVAP